MHNIVADPAEIITLRSVLDEYCINHFVTEAGDRDECARKLLALFSSGVTSREALLARMNGLPVGIAT